MTCENRFSWHHKCFFVSFETRTQLEKRLKKERNHKNCKSHIQILLFHNWRKVLRQPESLFAKKLENTSCFHSSGTRNYFRFRDLSGRSLDSDRNLQNCRFLFSNDCQFCNVLEIHRMSCWERRKSTSSGSPRWFLLFRGSLKNHLRFWAFAWDISTAICIWLSVSWAVLFQGWMDSKAVLESSSENFPISNSRR